jgi:hypothetical protein
MPMLGVNMFRLRIRAFGGNRYTVGTLRLAFEHDEAPGRELTVIRRATVNSPSISTAH